MLQQWNQGPFLLLSRSRCGCSSFMQRLILIFPSKSTHAFSPFLIKSDGIEKYSQDFCSFLSSVLLSHVGTGLSNWPLHHNLLFFLCLSLFEIYNYSLFLFAAGKFLAGLFLSSFCVGGGGFCTTTSWYHSPSDSTL